MYGTPTKQHNAHPPRSSYKFFENYNIKCLMDERSGAHNGNNNTSRADKENLTSGNKATARKALSPVSHYKYIYKIIQTSTVLRQSPCSAKRQCAMQLGSIVSLECAEDLNARFKYAESPKREKTARFGDFLESMRADKTYAGYFESAETLISVPTAQEGETRAQACKRRVYGNMVTRLGELLNN